MKSKNIQRAEENKHVAILQRDSHSLRKRRREFTIHAVMSYSHIREISGYFLGEWYKCGCCCSFFFPMLDPILCDPF